MPGKTTVYIGDDGTIFDASLNQSQVAKNANKVNSDSSSFVHVKWPLIKE